MRKRLIAIILAVTMVLSLTACGEKSIVEYADEEMEVTEAFEERHIGDGYSIIVDKETGVCYLKYEDTVGYRGYSGITVMLNADGTPKIIENHIKGQSDR